jgi:photosystem II stability/assembly factor-like uncharacterized protein
MLRSAVIAAACVILASGDFAAAQEFQNIGIGGAGGLYTPVVSPLDPSLMMITCDMGGVYVSRDRGASWRMIDWTQLSGANQCRPLFDSVDTNVIYAVSGSVLKKSTDTGVTWQPVTSHEPWHGRRVNVLTMPPDARNPVYVGSADGLYRSADSGANWTRCRGVEGPCNALVAFSGGGAFAGTAHGLLRTRDGGATWEKVDLPAVGDQTVAALAGGSTSGRTVVYAVVPHAGLIRSEDLGKTWKPVLEDAGMAQVVMPWDQTQVAFACNRLDIYKTRDGGATWQKCFFMTGPHANVTRSWVQTELHWGYYITPKALGVSPVDPSFVMVATQGDFYISRNGGRHWDARIDKGIQIEGHNAYQSIGLEVTSAWWYLWNPWAPDTHYIAFTDIGFVRSPDGGQSWFPSATGSPWGNTYYQVAFSPFVKGRLYAAASNQHDIPHWGPIGSFTHTGGVIVSDDNGRTWRRLGTNLPQNPCTSLVIDPRSTADHVTLYVTMYGDGVYQSTNGGETWVRKANGLGHEGNHHVFMVKVQKNTGSIFCSITANRHGLSFPVPGGLWRSDDGGDSWTEVTKGLNLHWPGGFALDPRDPGVIYLTASTIPHSNEGGLYKTTDGGGTWTRLLKDSDFAKTGGASYVQAMFVRVAPEHPNRVYLSTAGHGLWYSGDAGQTWNRVQGIPFASISHVCFPPDTEDTFYVTTFGGAVWKGPAVPETASPAQR